MRKMKKFIGILLVALLFLNGCADNSSDEMSVTNEEPQIETSAVEQLPNAYSIILNNIYDALQLNPTTEEIDNVHFSTGIEEVVASFDTVDERMKAIAYCVMDVNSDEVEELLIVDTYYPEQGYVRILDMYTLVEGTSVRVIEGWARNSYFLLDDGVFFCSGSGGAAYSMNELLEYKVGATNLTPIELYFTYPKNDDMADIGCYYSPDGVYEVSEAMEISADEFQKFFDKCMSRVVEFDAYTFDSFK